jgi:hypothetical protein
MEMKLGIFAVPDATDSASTVEQILTADRVGLDLVGIQDHPYQRRSGRGPIGFVRRLDEDTAPRLRELLA